MSLTIIKPRQKEAKILQKVEFDYKNLPGSGFTFEVDDNGHPVFDNFLQEQNYRMCISSPDYEGPFFRTYDVSAVSPAEGMCSCGKVFALNDQYMGACECPNCGKWYNLFGQELKDPQHWGSECDY